MGLGWNVGAAGDVRVSSSLRLRVDYLYDRYATKEKTIDVGLGPMLPAFKQVPVRGKSQMHFVSFDLAWMREKLEGRRIFVMGGPTIFHRRVQLTAGDDRGIADVCETQWLQCSAETIGFDRWLGIKESVDYGFNVGVGLAFRTGLTASFVLEARYYYVYGPKYTSASGDSRNGSASFLPVSVGLRF
jgi:opacity protein-like surface antigen